LYGFYGEIVERSEDVLVGASQEQIDIIKEAIKKNDNAKVRVIASSLHAADLADIIENLTEKDRRKFIEILRPILNPDILLELDENIREYVFEQLGTTDVAAAVSYMETDEAVSVIEDLNESQQEEVLRAVPAEDRVLIEQALSYDEDSAGRIMVTDPVAIPIHWDVQQTRNYIQKSEDLSRIFYTLYVLDENSVPVGYIPVSYLFRFDNAEKIETIMKRDVRTVSVMTKQKEVSLLFRYYGLVSVPVVEEDGKFAGIISVDSVVEVIEEETEKEILHLSGVGSSDIHVHAFITAYRRFKWLIVTLINSLIASWCISKFQATIEAKVALAVLMPIVAAMGGASGTQVVTVIIRALATHEIKQSNAWRMVKKEVSVASINGFMFALILGFVSAWWFEDFKLSIIFGVAIFCNMIWITFIGVTLPMLLDKFDLDPALSAAPFIATITDILGYSSFLGIASIFLF
jgi:magnesium transporter